MKNNRDLEAEVNQAIIAFEKDYMGCVPQKTNQGSTRHSKNLVKTCRGSRGGAVSEG